MRGLWDSIPATRRDGARRRNQRAERLERAPHSARRHRDVTASIGPFPSQDRVPAEVALAYAAPADRRSRTPGARRSRAAVVTNKGVASIANKPSEAVAQQPC